MKLMIEKSTECINKVVDFRKNVFDKIVSRNRDQIWLKASLRDVKKVILINSAPRSGSSLLFAVLKKIPQVYSLSGESVPFYKLNGLSSDYFFSDKIPAELAEIRNDNFPMSRDFMSDFSITNVQDSIIDNSNLLNQYIDDLVLRFSMQWPEIDFSYTVFRKLANRAFNAYAKRCKKFCKEIFYIELLEFLRREYSDINPYYYDIPQDMIKARFPDLDIPVAPPNNVLTIEEPPFILLSPDKKVAEKDLSEKVLLLKSSVNCYRMDCIKNIFPNADIRVIYLTRNPAASINGLYDGWLYRGFFSHNLESFIRYSKPMFKRLKIAGYSDKYEWGKWWWNYDLPPGWQDYTERSLEEVCAFQWCFANKTIQEYMRNGTIQYIQIKYENIAGNFELRYSEMKRIIDFMGMDKEFIKALELERLPLVQATHSPQFSYRWKKRRNIISPLLNNFKIYETYNNLGYNKENIEEWI